MAISINFICAIATYIIGYSALLSIELAAGSYEDEQFKKNSCLIRFFKAGFLSFVGPLYLVLVEILQLIKAVFMLIAILGGPGCVQSVESAFDKVF